MNIVGCGSSRKLIALALAFLLAGVAACSAEPKYEATWSSLDQRPCPQWFLDAKFGIFIHRGFYSVPAWGAPKPYADTCSRLPVLT